MLSPKSLQGFDRRVWVLFYGRVISATGFSIVMPFLSIYLYFDMGLPMSQVGLLFLGTAVAGAIGQMAGGEMADRLGRRPVMYISIGARGFNFVLLSLVIAAFSDLLVITVLLLISSFLGSLFEPASNAMVADLVGPGRRLEAYGLLRIGQNVGWTLGPLIGGILAVFSYSSLFLLSALTSISVALIIYMLVPDPQRSEHGHDRFRLRDLRKVADNRIFLLFCIFALPLAIVLGQMSSVFAVFSKDTVGISEIEIGYLYALNGIMVVFLQLPMARYIAHFKMSYVLAAGALMYAVGYLIVGWADSIWVLVLSMIITTLGENTTSPSATNMVANMAPDNERGRYMGISGLFHTFGWSLGPACGGLLFDLFTGQPVALWATIAGIASISAIGYAYIGRLAPDSYDRVITEPVQAKS